MGMSEHELAALVRESLDPAARVMITYVDVYPDYRIQECVLHVSRGF